MRARFHSIGPYILTLVGTLLLFGVVAAGFAYWQEQEHSARESRATEYHLGSLVITQHMAAALATLQASGTDEVSGREAMDTVLHQGAELAKLQERHGDPAFRATVKRLRTQSLQLSASLHDPLVLDSAIDALYSTIQDLDKLHVAAHQVDHARLAAARQAQIRSFSAIIAILAVLGSFTTAILLRSVRRVVNEREYAETLLRQTVNQLNRAQHMARLGSWDWDLVADSIVCSDEAYRIFGVEPGYFDANPLEQFLAALHPDDRVAQRRAIEQAIAGTQPYAITYRLIRPDGEVRDIANQAEIEFDDAGRAVRMVGWLQDVTEQHRRDEMLRQQDERLRFHVERTPLGVVAFDLHNHITEWNPAAEALFGWSREEALGRDMLALILPEDIRSQLSEVAAALNRGEPNPHVINDNVTRDGRRITCEWFNTPLRDGGGAVIGVASMVQDVSERERIQQELTQFKDTLDATQDCVFMFRPHDLRFFYVNKGAMDQVGYTEADMLQMTPLDIKPEYTEESFRRMITPLLKGVHAAHTFETVHRHRDGTDIPVEVFLQYVPLPNDQDRFVALVRDITERRRAAAELQESKNRLARSQAAAGLAGWSIDFEVNEFVFTPEMCQLMGLAAESTRIAAADILAMFHPDDRAAVMARVEGARGGNPVGGGEFRFRRADDGSQRVMYTEMHVLERRNGRSIEAIGIAQDTTEQYEAKRELEQSRSSLSRAQAVAHIGSWDLDVTTDTVTWSDEIFRILGEEPRPWPGNEVSNAYYMQFVHPDDHDRVNRAARVGATGTARYDLDYRIVRRDGTERVVHEQADFLRDESGQLVRVIGTVQDITERKAAEDALRVSQRSLEQAQAIAHLGNWDWNIVENTLAWSDEVYRMFGLEPQQFGATYEAFLSYVHPDDRPLVESAVNRALTEGIPYSIDHRLVSDGNVEKWVHEQGEVIFGDTGDPIFMRGTVHDVTARKEAEAELRHRLEFEELLISLATRFVNLPPEQIDVGMRQAMAAVTRFTQDEYSYLVEFSADGETATIAYEWHAPGSQSLQAFYTDVASQSAPRLVELLRQGQIVHVPDTRRAPPEFETETAMWDATRIRSFILLPLIHRGQLAQVVGFATTTSVKRWPKESIGLLRVLAEIFTNALERKHAAAELDAYRTELEQRVEERTRELAAVNQELEAFAYSVSHDLRAPLRAMEGYSAALWEDYGGILDADGKHYVNRVRAATKRMDTLITDLLDLSRVTRRELRPSDVNLSGVARDVVRELSEQHPDRVVDWDIAPDLHTIADARLMHVVFVNLLGNALKFTANQPDARVELACASNGETDPTYVVRDNGAGFDMAYAEKLFGAFQRLHHQDEFPGTGIGLATVQRIINKHGGRIWAESAPGAGAAFYFTLPGQGASYDD